MVVRIQDHASIAAFANAGGRAAIGALRSRSSGLAFSGVSSPAITNVIASSPFARLGGSLGGSASAAVRAFPSASSSASRSSLALTIGPADDVLSSAAIFTMGLLAVQYCAQPPLTRKCLDNRTNKRAVTFLEELMKMSLSLGFFLACGSEAVASELAGWTLKSSLLLAGLPALLYATQGVLTYKGYQNTDSVTFNGLNQTKTLSAAFWCFLLMGKRQSPVQIVALGVLFASALLFQGTISISAVWNRLFSGNKKVEPALALADTIDAIDAKPEPKRKTSFSKGIVPCLAAAFISGLAGALSQKGVQMAAGKGVGRNPYLYTVELSVYSAIALFVSMFAKKGSTATAGEQDGDNKTGGGGMAFFRYFTPASMIPITLRALGGVLTALVHKYAGATRKGFALILGLILTGVTQSVVEKERLGTDELLAMGLVILSSYLHLCYPPGIPKLSMV